MLSYFIDFSSWIGIWKIHSNCQREKRKKKERVLTCECDSEMTNGTFGAESGAHRSVI